MAVEESVINFFEIKQIMLKEYGIKVIMIKKINRGSANIYEIFSYKKRYILKEFQKKIKSENIEIEYTVTTYLKKYNIPTPDYVLNKNGKIYCEYKNKIIIVQKFIDGIEIESNTSDKKQIIESVQMYGKIIKALESYPYKLPEFRRHLMSKEICKDDINNIENLINKSNNKKINQNLLYKKEVLRNLENLDYSWISKLTYKKSHGDYNVFQFIYDENGKIKSVIDFVATRNMPISRELIRNYFFMAKEIKKQIIDYDFFIEYIQEFCKYQMLNEYDLKYMPLLYYIELSKTIYGYNQYIQNKSKEYLKYGNELYNQWMCLKRNYIELSNKLSNLK